MIIIISPSKTIEQFSAREQVAGTQPQFLKTSQELVHRMQTLSTDDLAQLMRISPSLARLTHERFISWHMPFDAHNSHPALLSFKGEVFSGISAHDFTAKDMDFAQNHLCILSGLYGALRPLDLIQPYRLEMGTKIDIGEHENLYRLWTDTLTRYLTDRLHQQKSNVLINLASNEYAKAVNLKKLNTQIITPIFLDQKGDELKTITIYAKRARGLMTRFAIKNRIAEAEQLKAFTEDGYLFSENLSNKDKWVFIR